MVIPIEQWGEDPGAKAWKDKKIGKLLWVGSSLWLDMWQLLGLTPAFLLDLCSVDETPEVTLPTLCVSFIFCLVPVRSSLTDNPSHQTPWRSSHRPRIARMASEDLAAPVDIIPPATWVNPGQKKVKDLKLELVQGTLNKNLMDLGLAYEPVQCSVDDGTCKRIKEELQFRDVLTFDQGTYFCSSRIEGGQELNLLCDIRPQKPTTSIS